MATHNHMRVLGYVLKDPTIINLGEEGLEKVIFQVRTIRRKTEGYRGKKFEDIVVFYDGEELIKKMKDLKEYDLVDIKGVFNVMTVDKTSVCPYCGTKNVKEQGSSTFIYPISINKLDSLKGPSEHNPELPEAILKEHHLEVSNNALIIGTVVSDPELIGSLKIPCCRYRLGVDRKYYVKTQGNVTADYPWVYSYDKQALSDYEHLHQGSVVLVDGFMHNRQVNAEIKCSKCGSTYTYPDVVTEFIPYTLEYLSNYMTNEDIVAQREREKRKDIHKNIQYENSKK